MSVMNDDEVRDGSSAERERLESSREAPVSGGDVGRPEGQAIEGFSVVDQEAADIANADIANEAFDLERDLSLLEQVRSDLDDVDSALRRLEEDHYGRCEACGEAIGDERLEASPAARLCLAHQQAADAGGEAAPQMGPPGRQGPTTG